MKLLRLHSQENCKRSSKYLWQLKGLQQYVKLINPSALAKVNVSNHSQPTVVAMRGEKMVLIPSGIHLPEVLNEDVYIQE